MKSKRFFELSVEEPFRIFFPLGVLLGVVGVLLWPLFLLGVTQTYPAIAHARLMIEGMMSCFVFGFLGTAGPRLMSARHFSRPAVLSLVASIISAATAHLFAFHTVGDALFLVALLVFVTSLARRFHQREDSPPPNFALVGLGMLNGLVGSALIVSSEVTNSAPTLYRLGVSLLNIGFVLLPVLGVAPFFLRRLLDLPMNLSEERGRHRSLALALGLGLVIDGSFVIELSSSSAAAGWIRCGCAAAYVAIILPMCGSNLLATALRMSIAALVAGLGLLAMLPAYRISALHVLFIGGFTVALFSVATRVVLGHSGNLSLLPKRRWVLVLTLLLVILAMVSRFTADFVATRNEHLIGAAIAWLAGAIIWSLVVLPNVGRVEPD